MRFGGHETFTIREGWLHKGLNLLTSEPEKLFDEYAADWLGVGKNMARSIRYWLLATGLADYDEKRRVKRERMLAPSKVGALVQARDPYFSHLGTWWALHINLVNQPQGAMTWAWFFNTFAPTRFEKSVALAALTRYLRLSQERLPAPRTLDRDVICLLRSYSRQVPSEVEDPEEALDCPLMELGLLTYFRQSGYYQVNQALKDIPPAIIGYCMSKAYSEVRTGAGRTDIPLVTAARDPGGPGRCFCLTSESFFETLTRAEGTGRRQLLEIAGLAGNRVIRISQMPAHEWLDAYYDGVAAGEKDAA